MKVVGYHGTCVSAAQGILANGFRTVGPKMLAGPGAYLWAGSGALREKALLLCETWHTQRKAEGAYDGEKDQRLAIVRYEAEVAFENLVDLEQMLHHEQLAALNQFATRNAIPFKDAPALYTAYIAKVRKERGTAAPPRPPVLVVRLTLPPPDPYRTHPQRALGLTAGVDAYMLLQQLGGKVPVGAVSLVQL
jgi:hypothetical protein